METDTAMNDTDESFAESEGAAARPSEHDRKAPEDHKLILDPDRKLGRGVVFGVIALAVVLLIAIAVGIHSRVSAETRLASNAQRDAVLSVAVTTPAVGADALEIVLPANTQAYIDTPIYARTNGYLKHWYADIGAHVKRGQVLAEIETPELDEQLQQVESDLATAQSNLKIAEITSDRWQKLLAKNAVSRQEADQAQSDFAARQSALLSAEANVRRVKQLQDFEKIYAPFDGVITARNVDVGSLIQAGDSADAKAELFHLASADKLRLFVPVPEVYASAVHNGQTINITSDAAPEAKITGVVTRNSDAIDTTNRTLNVEVDVANADHRLLPGQYAFVHLPIPPSSASMTLPANALIFRAEGLQVGLVRDGKVALVPVKVGHDYGAKVEIIAGLTPRDEVILNPSDSIAAGEAVRVEKGAAQ